jgi:hypothetical protein
MNRSPVTPDRVALLLVLLLYVGLWIVYPHYFVASDPWDYSKRAFEISRHLDFGGDHVFNQRLTVVVPVAVLYSAFGVGLWTTDLWPLVAVLAIIVAVWLALPDESTRIAGMALAASSIVLLRASTALWPDIIATAFMAWSSLVLFNRRRLVHAGPRRLVPQLAVALLFAAGLAKETAAWMLPLWVSALACDLASRERAVWLRRFHLPAVTTAVALLGVYLAFCWLVWSDPLAHFRSVDAIGGTHPWSWANLSPDERIDRLTLGPARLLHERYGLPILLLAAGGAVLRETTTRPWAWYTGCCLLLYWFGSASLTRYAPLPLEARMTYPLLPGLLVLAAVAASRLAALLAHRARARRVAPVVVLLALVGLLTGLPFARWVAGWRGRSEEADAMDIVRREVVEQPLRRHLLICSDQRSPRSLAFHFGYEYPDNLLAVSIADLRDELLVPGRHFVFRDRSRSRFLRRPTASPITTRTSKRSVSSARSAPAT